jgi:hypothetical protein
MPDFSLERIETWLEALEERSVHSPLAYYAPTEAQRSLFHALCQTYLEASDRERSVIRSAVSGKKGVLNQLLGLVYKAAEQLRATQDVTWLRIGAAAASMQSGHLDYRDFLLALADLYVSAEEAGLDPESEFAVMGIGLPANFHAYAVVRGRRSRPQIDKQGD